MLKRILPVLCILVFLIGLVQGKEIKASADSERVPTTIKLALLVGIGQYEQREFPRLIGPSRDVDSMSELLQAFYAFEPQNILKLQDRAATREAILAGFKKHLIENARKHSNAVVYIYINGMGSTVPDLNGDEADGRDEAILPYDARPNGVNYLTDDELDEILIELSKHTSNVTFVYDTCYGFNEWQPDRDRAGTVTPTSSQSRPAKNGLVFISSSSPGQRAMDPSPLTAHLIRELRRTPIATYRDVMQRVIVGVSAETPRQTPQVEGDIDRLFLGGAGRIFEVRTSPANIAQLKLNGGRRQGLNEGVRVAVYKPNPRSFTDYEDKLTEAVIINATDNSAIAVITGKVALPARAIAIPIAPENRERIRVALDQSLSGLANSQSLINSLTKRFDNSFSAVLVDEAQSVAKRSMTSDSWDVVIKSGKFGKIFGEASKQLEMAARDESRQLPIDDEDVLYLAGPNGQPLFGFFVEATNAQADTMIVNMVREAAAQRSVQRLYRENSSLNKALDISVVRVEGEIKVTGLLRILEERPVRAEEGSGTIFRLKYGELFRLKVRNKSSEDIHLTGFNLRADGNVETFKEDDPDEKLRAGATYVTPVFRATGLAGEDVFKFLVSTSPLNLTAQTRGVSPVTQSQWGTAQVSLLVAAPSPTETYPRGRVVEYISKSLYVLAVGLNKYSDPRRQLRFSVEDASAVAAVLKERGGEMYNVRVHLLLDEQATRANIETAFNTIMREAQPEDTFVFYNAASDLMGSSQEGSESWFIIPSDVRRISERDSELRKNAVSGELLINWVTGVRAKNQLLIFDSSLEALKRFVLRLTEDRKSADVMFKKNLVIFGGSGLEVPKAGHAEFTYHLLRGLKGAAYLGLARNQITTRDVLHFLSSAKSRRSGGSLFQSFSIGDDFALGSVPPNLAEKTRDAEPDTDFPDLELSHVERTGKDYALLIATSDYGDDSGFDDLSNPIRDAEAIGRVLEQQYGFEVELARNKTKREIEQLIESKYMDLGSNDDQIFIFFAGHGTYKERLRDGGVAVTDSVAKDVNTYLRFAWIRDRLDNFKSNHVLLMVDVCYSGAFFKTVVMTDRDSGNRMKMTDADYYKERIKDKTRKAVASSALKPVSDGIPGTNSPFVTELLLVLRKTQDKEFITFDDIKSAVNRVKPGPISGDFGGAPGSDFFFVPKRNENAVTPQR